MGLPFEGKPVWGFSWANPYTTGLRNQKDWKMAGMTPTLFFLLDAKMYLTRSSSYMTSQLPSSTGEYMRV